MRIPALLFCAALGVSHARAEPLSAADREALLENLEKLREFADSKVDARFRVALAAYREAMATEETAIEFYLKCIEKVNFNDQEKKNSAFRDWKRKEADLLSDPGFRLTLRYQLHWLTMMLRATSEKTDFNGLAAEAQEIVDAIIRDADKLRWQEKILNQAVTSTVFARVYEIGNLEKNRLPSSPTQLEEFYENIVFPRLRSPARVDALRAAWIKRIQQEGIRTELWTNNGNSAKNGQNSEPRSPELVKFTTETVPQLQWQMEMDLFQSGDESGAAKRMLDHIEKHLDDRFARAWGQQFKNLLTPAEAPAAAGASGKSPGT